MSVPVSPKPVPSTLAPSKPLIVLRPVRSRPEGLLHSPERLEAVRAWLRAPRATAQLERIVRWATLTTGGEAGLCCVVSKNTVRVVAMHNLALAQFKFKGVPQMELLLPEFTTQLEDALVLEPIALALGLHFSPAALRIAPLRFHGQVIGAMLVFERGASATPAPSALQLLSELALEAAETACLAPVTTANPPETDQHRAAVVTLGQQLPVLLFNLDATGRFAHVEGRVLELLEIEAAQCLGRSAFEVWRDPSHPGFLEILRRTLVSTERVITDASFTWREQRFNIWMTPCDSGLTGLALMLDSSAAPAQTTRSSQSDLALIEFPGLSVALEFINGVGGLRYFTAQMECDAAWSGERLVLSGRGVRIVVERGDLNDLRLSGLHPVR